LSEVLRSLRERAGHAATTAAQQRPAGVPSTYICAGPAVANRIRASTEIGDLISYRNDRKDRTMFTGKVQEIVNKYSTSCIDMRADEVLISAE
jgi:hypothetical protein